MKGIECFMCEEITRIAELGMDLNLIFSELTMEEQNISERDF